MISSALLDAMRRIDHLLRSGNFRTAQEQLEIIVEENPDFTEARRLLAGAKLALGDTGGAEKILREAVALDPAWSPALTMLGELLLAGGRHAEAEQVLLRAATATQADPRAALVLARRYNDTSRHAQALAIATPFCAAGKAAPELAALHVNAMIALGRGDEAIGFYRGIVADSPDNTTAAHALAIALQAVNRHEEAERALRPVLSGGHSSAALCYTRARGLIALGEFERAESTLRDCLRLEPQHVDAHGDFARLIWMGTGDVAQATAMLDQALRKFAHNDALWAARAAVLQGAGNPRGAYECLAQRIQQTSSPALLVRAGLAALEFDPQTAVELAQRALKVLPGDVPARKLLAAALLGVGDASEALPLCEALLNAEPHDQYLIALQTTAWRLLDDPSYTQACDYRQFVVAYQLQVPQPWSDLAGFLADVKRSLERLHEALRHPLLFQSLRHGTETTEDLTHSEDPAIRALFAAFDAPIRDYMARAGNGTDFLRTRNNGMYRFNGSWSVRLRASGFHHNHVHPRGWISSACYIDLPAVMSDAQSREGALTFGEPGIITKPPLHSEHEVRPTAGMLVLFPSYFWHGTVPFSGERTRLTVAFDAVPDRPR
jgi:tetratricopeptide (TPR) repeat protein